MSAALFCSIVLFYIAVVMGAGVASLAVWLRSASAALVLAIFAIGGGVVGGYASGGGELLVLGLEIGAIAGSVLSYAVLLRPRMTWRAARSGKEVSRRALIHLILASGSIVFSVPFAWLVATSLKEDEDMSHFPPIWIPRQQVREMVDGKPLGLATANYHGKIVKVGVLKEMESGERDLEVLEPADQKGNRFTLPRSQVHKIKRFDPVWKNYPDALKFLPPETKSGLVFMTNTVLLSSLAVLGTVLSGSLVAFSFARLRWPGRDTLFVIVLATMMLPGAVTMMPVFLIFRQFGWIDTLRPLWAPAFLCSMTSGFNSAFYVFLMRQFFLTIPNDLEDAAKIDGCSYFGIYSRIMLPLVKPALAAVTIMTFMASWNNFMGPLIYVSSPLRMPLSYALSLFQSAHGGEPGLLMAAAVLMILPVLILFFFTQRYFIQGVTLTGIKG